MKKVALLVVVLIASIMAINAQSVKYIYHFDTPIIKTVGEYQIVTYPDAQQIAKVGDPILPFIPVKLLLPPETTAKTIKFVFENSQKLEGKYQIYPQQEVRPLSDDTPYDFIKNNATYQLTQYPELRWFDVNTQFMNGYGFALSKFTPIKYNPATGEVEYYKKVTVIVEYENSQKAENALNNLSSRPEVVKKIEDFAQNPDAISLYPQKKSFNFDDYEMLIITTEDYVNSFDDLKATHFKRGIRTKVVSLSDIISQMSGVDVPEKMRNYIIQEYQNHNIEYVMLGGDADVVPFRALYCEALSGGQTYSGDLPADVYFSALDGTWNDDGDSHWGEPDEDDLLPDIAVGRIPFSNSTELANIIHKVVYYSDYPVTSTGELNNPLLAGESLWDNPETWGADYLDLLIGHHEDNGYTTDGIPESSTYTTMYSRDGTWDESGSAMMSAMNSGHSFVHHVGHANSDFFMGLYTSDITSSNFSNLNGTTHNYALVYSHGCICGAFDADDCVSETMVKIDKCAVGVFTNSRYGWFNEGQTEGPSTHLHREFVDALYHDKQNTAGVAEMISKYETAPWVENPDEYEPGAQRWVFYDHNVLTDPALPIWTANPFTATVQYDTDLPLGATYSVTVTDGVNVLQNYTCIIVQNNMIVGKALTDANGEAVIQTDINNTEVGSATLIVSGYNILPQEYSINIVEAEGVVLSSNSFNFSDDNNNLPECNEDIFVNFTIKNYGQQNATNVNVTLTCDDENIDIITGTANISEISSGDSAVIENVLKIKANTVEDQYRTTLHLQIASDQYTTERNITLTLNAPKIEYSNVSITETSGNGNGYLEPGETGTITFYFKNAGHSKSQAGNALITSATSGVTINSPNQTVAEQDVDSTFAVSSDITLSSSISAGQLVNVNVDLQIPGNNLQADLNFYAGSASETYETGDFSAFDWQNEGDANWNVQSSEVYQGSYAAKSGYITDEQTSVMKIQLEVLQDGEVSFFKKVSSEEDYDYLKFYIDGQLQDKWSGDVEWSSEQFPVSAGEHTFEWTYEKDMSVDEGQDCAWIDNITFPLIGNIVVTDTIATFVVENSADIQILVYPQPATNYVNFKFDNQSWQNVRIDIYDISGRNILTKMQKTVNGENIITQDISDLQSGLYLYVLTIGNSSYQGKFLKK